MAARCIEKFDLDRMCFAVMLGGADGRTLYMVANEWTGTVDVEPADRPVFSTRVTCRTPAIPEATYRRQRRGLTASPLRCAFRWS